MHCVMYQYNVIRLWIARLPVAVPAVVPRALERDEQAAEVGVESNSPPVQPNALPWQVCQPYSFSFARCYNL